MPSKSRVKKEHVLEFLLIIVIYSFLYRNLLKVINYRWIFGELYRDFSFSEPLYIWKKDEFAGLNMMPLYLGTVLKLFSTFGNNCHLVLYLAIPVVSFILFALLIRKILQGSLLECFIGSLLYSLNPVITSIFIMGEYGPLLAYMAQPLIFLGLYELMINHKESWIFIFPVVGVFLLVNIYHIFWSSIFIAVVIFIFAFLKSKNIKKLSIPFKSIICLVFIFFLVQLPLIIQYSCWIFGKHERLSSVIVNDYSYQDASFMNVIRLCGNKGSAQAKVYLDYNSLNSFTIFGYLHVFIIMLSMEVNEKNKKTKHLYPLNLATCLSYLLIVGLILFIHYYPETLNANPIFYSLRNPVKLQCPQALLFSLSFVFGLTKVEEVIKTYLRKKLYMNVMYLLLGLSIVMYNQPALDGTLGLARARANFYTDRYRQEEMLQIMNLNKRTLVLPWNLLTQKSLYIPNRLNPPTGSIVSIGSELELIRCLYERVSLCKFEDIKPYLQILDVKYILLIRDITCPKNNTYISYDTWMVDICTQDIMYILEDDSDFKKILENEQVVVFEYERESSKFSIVLNYTTPEVFGLTDTAVEDISRKLSSNNFEIISEYEKIDPTTYIIKVNAVKPFVLSFAEPYDPLWVADVSGRKVRSKPLYSIINSFYINQTGPLTITIEYKPQKWFYKGSAISVTTIIACIMYLTYERMKNKISRLKQLK